MRGRMIDRGTRTVVRFDGRFTAKDIARKVAAFRDLFGREPEVHVMGVFDLRDGTSDFWPRSPAKLLCHGRRYLTVAYYNEVLVVDTPKRGDSVYFELF